MDFFKHVIPSQEHKKGEGASYDRILAVKLVDKKFIVVTIGQQFNNRFNSSAYVCLNEYIYVCLWGTPSYILNLFLSNV